MYYRRTVKEVAGEFAVSALTIILHPVALIVLGALGVLYLIEYFI